MAAKALRRISFLEARTIAAEKGLVPVYIRGTDLVPKDGRRGGVFRFAKADARLVDVDGKLQLVSWEYFEAMCGERGLGVYEADGWMRLKRIPGAD